MALAAEFGALGSHPDDLRCDLHVGEEVGVLRLEGSLRAPAVQEGDGLVAQISVSPLRSLLVDASLLWEIDEAGIRLLMSLREAVEDRKGKMIVYAASGAVARALDDSHLRN